MQKNIVILLIFFMCCNTKKEALGLPNDIFVFSSPEDRIFIEESIENKNKNKGLHCPQFEPYLNIKYKHPEDLNEYHKYRNLLFASISSPQDTTLDILINGILNETNNKKSVSVINNLYSLDQTVGIIKAFDPIHFETVLDSNMEWLQEQYMEKISKNILEKEIKKNKNSELIQLTEEMFNLDIPITMDYIKIKKGINGDFLWIGRAYPYRWITIHSIELPNNLTPDAYWEKFQYTIENSMKNVEISEFYRKNKLCKLTNRKVITGIYGEVSANTGGPFVSHIIEDKNQNKAFFLTGYVNNPGKSKILMLQELELLFQRSNYLPF